MEGVSPSLLSTANGRPNGCRSSAGEWEEKGGASSAPAKHVPRAGPRAQSPHPAHRPGRGEVQGWWLARGDSRRVEKKIQRPSRQGTRRDRNREVTWISNQLSVKNRMIVPYRGKIFQRSFPR
ncbi:hypothetical protein chiPu_0013377 [Chiloscyllium punctatum]|uniref:Uncharacterized protein n=1 Tax=Chiloscyllium punctatum TaxID=137246 RepID=A0A401SX06_CHIPU|nr:hypothetical protein [Chiloscyllium punctatum]